MHGNTAVISNSNRYMWTDRETRTVLCLINKKKSHQAVRWQRIYLFCFFICICILFFANFQKKNQVNVEDMIQIGVDAGCTRYGLLYA